MDFSLLVPCSCHSLNQLQWRTLEYVKIGFVWLVSYLASCFLHVCVYVVQLRRLPKPRSFCEQMASGFGR